MEYPADHSTLMLAAPITLPHFGARVSSKVRRMVRGYSAIAPHSLCAQEALAPNVSGWWPS
jgi:hypothetical protein